MVVEEINQSISQNSTARDRAGGFAVFYRSLREQPWYKNSEYKAVFIELVLRAQYQATEKTYKGIKLTLKRGQVFTCNQQLSNDTGVSVSQVKKAITLFKKLGQVDSQKVSNKGALISVVNYDKWQSKVALAADPVIGVAKEPVKATETKAIGVISKPLIELVQELDLELQSNKANNLEFNTPLTPELAFEIFWSFYPKKLGKQPAMKKFVQLLSTAKAPIQQFLQILQNVLLRYRQEPQTWRASSKYCLHPSTYLNQARYKDEILNQESQSERAKTTYNHQTVSMGRTTSSTQSAQAAFAVIHQLNNS